MYSAERKRERERERHTSRTQTRPRKHKGTTGAFCACACARAKIKRKERDKKKMNDLTSASSSISVSAKRRASTLFVFVCFIALLALETFVFSPPPSHSSYSSSLDVGGGEEEEGYFASRQSEKMEDDGWDASSIPKSSSSGEEEESLLAPAPKEKLTQNKVNEYPTCERGGEEEFEEEEEFVGGGGETQQIDRRRTTARATARVKKSWRFTKPFKYATYFCDVWPKDVYENLTKHWPPMEAFSNYASKSKSCRAFGCRYAMDIGAILKRNGKAGKKWKEHEEARATWQLLNDVVFSKTFEEALFEKLGVKSSKVKRREIRIFSDDSGQSNGRVHTDMDAMKVATMMLYVTDRTGPMWDYGTCLHTTDQWKRRKKMKLSEGGRPGRGDGESPCEFKFRYLPNTGYAFRVSRDSWHSAPNSNIKHWRGIPRNSILVNWY